MEIKNYSLPIIQKEIIHTQNQLSKIKEDFVAFEEPLEIRVNYINSSPNDLDHKVAVTMSTPGNDYELVAGFLLAEGFIDKPEQLLNVSYCKNETNVVRAKIANTKQQGSLRGITPVGQKFYCIICIFIEDVIKYFWHFFWIFFQNFQENFIQYFVLIF